MATTLIRKLLIWDNCALALRFAIVAALFRFLLCLASDVREALSPASWNLETICKIRYWRQFTSSCQNSVISRISLFSHYRMLHIWGRLSKTLFFSPLLRHIFPLPRTPYLFVPHIDPAHTRLLPPRHCHVQHPSSTAELHNIRKPQLLSCF